MIENFLRLVMKARPSPRLARVFPVAFLAVLGAGRFCAPRADVVPLEVGNQWTYTGNVVLRGIMGDPIYYRQTEKLQIKVASVAGAVGEYRIFTLEFTDTLKNRVSFSMSGNDTLRLRDTVVAWTRSFADEGNDTVSPLVAPAMNLPPGAPGILRNVFLYDGFSRLHSHPHGTYSALEGGKFRAWRNRVNDSPVYGAPVDAWYVEGVGLYWLRIQGGRGCDGTIDRTLTLATFNGRTVDLGLSPDSTGQPLAKQSRAACGIRRPGTDPVVFSFETGALDPLGRKLARPASGPPNARARP